MMTPIGIILLACCMMIGFNQIILVFAGFRVLNTLGIERGMLIKPHPDSHPIIHTFQYHNDFRNHHRFDTHEESELEKEYITTTVRIPVCFL